MGRLHPARYIKEDDVMPLALSQSNPDVGSSPSFCSGRKLGDIEQALLWSLLQEDPQCPSRLLLDEAARRQRPIAVSLRQLNRWRVQWQLNRRQGRPRQREHSVILTSHRGPLYNQQERATSPCEERSHLWEQLRLSRSRRCVQENSGTRSATNSMTALTNGSMDCRSSSQSPSRP